MDKLRIHGGNPLRGQIEVSGAKNAALPILISSLLNPNPVRLTHVPRLQDIHSTLGLLEHLGVKCSFEGNEVRLDASQISSQEAPYDLVRKMRASVLVLGPILARFGTAKVSLPGGCAIGARPVNFHLSALEKLGAKIRVENGYIYAESKKLKGERVVFEFPSVGATENLMMAATLAEGETILENCAREPEIIDLARLIRAMGVSISGEGTSVIRIVGVETPVTLNAVDYAVMGDRIEAGTFLASALATEGDVQVNGISPDTLEAVLQVFESTGAQIIRSDCSIRLKSKGRPRAFQITTAPFPGFPTDMQAQLMAVASIADGASVIRETIFENRFMHVPELMRLGADITIKGNSAIIQGRESLTGAPLMATDLRASASLIIGALAAKGESTLSRIYHLDRGYERIEEKLQSLGAKIERIS